MKQWILVAEDAPITRNQLTKLIQEAMGQEVEVTSADTIAGAIGSVEKLRQSGNILAAAVIDAMMPLHPGETAQIARPVVQCLEEKSPQTPVMFVSAYDTEQEASLIRAEYTARPDNPGSYFISKADVDWGDQVVSKLKLHIYGGPIRSELQALFGATPGCPPATPASRIGGRASGIGSRLEVLTYQIRQHYPDLGEELQADIRRHFEVDDSDRNNIQAGLRLTE